MPDGLSFFVRQRVKGVPVAEYRRGPLPLRARLELFVSVCEAVGFAHHRGVAHRDIRSSNVPVETTDRGPVPKVIDFGTAAQTANTRDDVYALGALLSELLVGANRSNADRVALDRIVTAALRDERGHETADAIAADVQQFLDGDSGPAADRPRRSRAIFVAVALTALAFAVVWAVR